MIGYKICYSSTGYRLIIAININAMQFGDKIFRPQPQNIHLSFQAGVL